MADLKRIQSPLPLAAIGAAAGPVRTTAAGPAGPLAPATVAPGLGAGGVALDSFSRDGLDPASLLNLQKGSAEGVLAALKTSNLLAARHRLALSILRNIGA